jgi:glutamyl-tRNA reductase
VEYARRIFDVFSDKTVLSIGAGKMAWLVLANLAALKPGKLWICNREGQKAQHLAEKFGGATVAFDALGEHLSAADIVVTSTGSTRPIITRGLFETAMRRRRNRPVFVIDIAVPRDVAPAVGELPNVYLYNLDDLQKAVAEIQTQRGSAVEAARGIVREQVIEFTAWQRAREMGPMIDQLYRQSHALAQEELARTLGKLPNVSSAEKQHLEDLTRRIVNKLLHDPVQMLREADGMHGSINQYLHAMEKLFQLDGSAGPAASKADEDAEE